MDTTIDVKELQSFKEKYPFIKRFLLVESEQLGLRVIAWISKDHDIAIKLWNMKFSIPLRIIPELPLENGFTQEIWNKVWDQSKTLVNGIRLREKIAQSVMA